MLRTIAPRPALALLAAPRVRPDYIVPIRDMQYELPPDCKVKVGATILFVNYDVEPHTVTAETNGPDGKPLYRFMLNRGESKTLTIDASMVGLQSFYCEFHPMMEGRFAVEAAPPQPTPPPAPQR